MKKVQVNAKIRKEYRDWLADMQEATRLNLVVLLEQAIELRYRQWVQSQKVEVVGNG